MPPQKVRSVVDDSKSETSSSKDRQSAHAAFKGRRNGASALLSGSALKDVTNAPQTAVGQQKVLGNQEKVNKSVVSTSLLFVVLKGFFPD